VQSLTNSLLRISLALSSCLITPPSYPGLASPDADPDADGAAVHPVPMNIASVARPPPSIAAVGEPFGSCRDGPEIVEISGC